MHEGAHRTILLARKSVYFRIKSLSPGERSLCCKSIMLFWYMKRQQPSGPKLGYFHFSKFVCLKFLKFCLKLGIQNRKILLEVVFEKDSFWRYYSLIFLQFCLIISCGVFFTDILSLIPVSYHNFHYDNSFDVFALCIVLYILLENRC